MKSTKKLGIIASLTLAFCIFLAGGIGLANIGNASAATVENVYIQEEYSINKVFTFPKAQIKVGETVVDSEYAYLVFPSGKAMDKSPVVLNEEGVYELVYTATVGGNKIKAVKAFTVSKQVYKVSGEKSSVYYGSHAALPALEGVVLNLANGDKFIYDEIIDISDNTKNDALVTFSMFTASKGAADVSEMVVTFTDIYDDNNYFSIYVKNVAEYGDWALRQSYLTAGATDQIPGGWENAPSGSNFHVNNVYGFPVLFTMAGSPADIALGYDVLTLSYDYATLAAYTTDQIYPGSNMIAQFDDSDTFFNPWKGFESGKVRMSITGVDFKSQTMGVVITEIDGAKPKQSVSTDVAPIISVDVDENNLPHALVDKEFKVFNASAFDAHEGAKDVAVHVYYNYGKENQTVCGIIDGKFIPRKAGVYTIVYSAVDRMGKRSVKNIEVEAVSGSGLSVELVGQAEKGKTGKTEALFSEIVCDNVSGEIEVAVTVDGQEILPEDGVYSYMPLTDGAHQVVVTVSDYVKTETISFEYTSTRNMTPQIFEDVVLPKYLIQGEEITLPTIYGHDFSSGSVKEKQTKIYVKENGGAEVELTSNKYAPSQVGTTEIIYRVDVSGRTNQKSVKVPVISVFDGDDLHIEKFFKPISGDVEVSADDNAVILTASKRSKVEFVNRVQVRDFYMTFVVDENLNAVNTIDVYFTDVADSTKQIKASYRKNMDGSAAFALNDGEYVNVDASFISDSKNFMITYSNGVLYGSAMVYANVTNYLDGRPFEGFNGDLAYLSIEMNVMAKSAIHLKNLNRQSLNDADRDRAAPQILADAIIGDRSLNDSIVIANAFAADVLSNAIDFTLKVNDPNGNFATAKDGTKLDGTADPTASYEVVLSSYGDYYIEFKAIDRFGKEKVVSYYVTAKDTVAPVVKLSVATTEASVGETITIAQHTATDDVSEKVNVFVSVETPDRRNVQVKDGQFVASIAGEYVVKYMVWDDAGNYVFKSYTVTVK